MSNGSLTLLLMLGVTVIGSNGLVLSPILPDVAAALDATPAAVARAIAAYGGATALSASTLGFVVDRHGVRATLAGGTVLLAIGTFGSAAAWHWTILAAGQVLAGLAAGVMLPAIYASATTTGTPAEGARILGRVLTGWSVSLVAGVPLSAFAASQLGWRAAYVLLGALASIALIGFLRLPRRSRPAASAAAADGPIAAIRLPGVAVLLLVQFLFMAAFYGVYAFLGDHLQTGLGLSTAAAGAVVLAYGVGFGLAALGDGAVTRIDPRRALPLALACVGAVYAAMPFVVTAPVGAFAAAFAWGFVNHAALNLTVLRLSADRGAMRGAVLGLNTAVTYLGALAGPLGLGTLYAGSGFGALASGGAACIAGSVLLASGVRWTRRGA
ncbi:MFS transporter [Jannaschia sp. LMIT008]|uniref:MFS transporter n=1 Tax=Jannaschia maritima TaxID=3032585 RepID=UPI002811EFF0|nr:MFS transporter [Jannaschia sp. LMIT008]